MNADYNPPYPIQENPNDPPPDGILVSDDESDCDCGHSDDKNGDSEGASVYDAPEGANFEDNVVPAPQASAAPTVN